MEVHVTTLELPMVKWEQRIQTEQQSKHFMNECVEELRAFCGQDHLDVL